MVDHEFRDQAAELRNIMNEINEQDHSVEETKEDANQEDLNILNLPPRSRVHANKKTKTKWKVSFPFVRFLFVLFILIVGLMLTFNFWGKELLTTNIIQPKNTSNTVGELVTIKSGSNSNTHKEQLSLQKSKSSQVLPIEHEKSLNYEVKDGDTLESIAIEFYGDEESKSIIIEANDLESNELQVGQVLIISNTDKEVEVE